MSVAFGIARMMEDIRFHYFPQVPDDEKAKLFLKLLSIPIQNQSVMPVVASMIQTNQWVQLNRFMRALKKHRMLKSPDHRKDYEMIRGLYFGEQNEKFATQLLTALHGFMIETADDQTLWNSVMNLLFSATCHQDKVAALFLLATK